MRHCQAANPSTCRVHGAKNFAPVTYQQAEELLTNARLYQQLPGLKPAELIQARKDVAEAQFLLYTTPEGQQLLRTQLNQTTDPHKKDNLQRVLDYAYSTRLSQEIFVHALQYYDSDPDERFISIAVTFDMSMKRYYNLLENTVPYRNQRKIEEKKIPAGTMEDRKRARLLHQKTMQALAFSQ